MNIQAVKAAAVSIEQKMEEQKDYLIQLDQQNGDGDLGLSMCGGFRALCDFLNVTEETDLGKIFLQASKTFNEAAPSSLGTILAFGMMGMAKKVKGKAELTQEEMTDALQAGVENIMAKAGSKAGEKTILDAFIPAIEELKRCGGEVSGPTEFWRAAAEAASRGSENTRQMKSIHGRAAYYAEKSIGVLDGGSVVGKLIFEGIADSVDK